MADYGPVVLSWWVWAIMPLKYFLKSWSQNSETFPSCMKFWPRSLIFDRVNHSTLLNYETFAKTKTVGTCLRFEPQQESCYELVRDVSFQDLGGKNGGDWKTIVARFFFWRARMEDDWAWASERRAGASGSSGDDDDDVRSFFGSTVRIENNWRAEAVSFFGICQQPTPHKRTLAKKGRRQLCCCCCCSQWVWWPISAAIK